MLYKNKKSTTVGSSHALRRLIYPVKSQRHYTVCEENKQFIHGLNIKKAMMDSRVHHNFLKTQYLNNLVGAFSDYYMMDEMMMIYS